MLKEFKIVKYENSNISIDVRYDKDSNTIWLTQSEIALVFSKTKANISILIKNIIDDNEMSVVKSYLTTEIIAQDGKKYVTNVYNLDIIEAISKRSKSTSGYEFVKWANKLISNYTHNEIAEISFNEDIKSKIYVIRGVQVMLDFELAEIYGYDTKRFNEQVKNNIDKFPTRYMFRLSNEEVDSILRSKKSTSSWGGNRYLPYAFTEQGVYMLMTILKGELATKQSIMLIDTFKAMKDYIIESNGSISNISLINDKFEKYDNRLTNVENQLTIVMDNFNNPKSFKHFAILDGNRIESDNAYQFIYSIAKSSIIIIDDYIDIKTLELLKICSSEINVTIISDNKSRNSLTNNYINDFKLDTGIEIKYITNQKIFHDRYIIIDYNMRDEIIYHCGTSSKDSGRSVDTIMRIDEKEVYHIVINRALNNAELVM